MKHYFAAAVIILVTVQGLYASDADLLFTDGMRNGNGFGSDSPVLVRDTEVYTMGCIDALCSTNNDLMLNLYSNATKGDIVESVKAYYRKNTARCGKAIVRVIIDGCK
jgi:hypothetical protein